MISAIVAISSRALFDFEAENKVFEQGDDREYMKLQRDLLDEPAKPGVAFSLIKKLLAFNSDNVHRVEVVVLSRNDPVSGLRVFKSAKHANLPLERGVFTRGRPPYHYLRPLAAKGVCTYNGQADVPFRIKDDVISVKLFDDWTNLGNVSDLSASRLIDPTNGKDGRTGNIP